jgi:hypothetical protein
LSLKIHKAKLTIQTTISKFIFVNRNPPYKASGIGYNGGGMASKGLRAMSYQVTRKVQAGYKPSHITEPLIGYAAY